MLDMPFISSTFPGYNLFVSFFSGIHSRLWVYISGSTLVPMLQLLNVSCLSVCILYYTEETESNGE